ncbi:membrane lipoprotein lipid attachment site-containing protein [Anaerococcus provencensis]|uniref:membrane lipoprotein lipid attachment site-containing protein n=1 Tax=Anaerococcus provencensis TaxID=938293 RepID=UPI0002F7E2A6|nr:membrane lipoprotein lipid attachment site-containing protein [Anaerococcus provencensis]
MKRILIIISLVLTLSACDFESRSEFEEKFNKKEQISDDVTIPKITYVPASDDDRKDTHSEDNKDKIDFEEHYGKGSSGKSLDPSKSLGNIVDTKVGDTQIGISLMQSVQIPGGYSTYLSYNRNDEFVEREFGPIAGFVGLSSTVAYDVIDSESGQMLLVSMVGQSNGDTYSAYYLFNKFMGLIDYLVFRNSVDNINPTVERLAEIVEAPETEVPGSIDQAIKARIDIENKHLPSLLDVYGIKTRSVVAKVDGRDMDIGYIPDIKMENRILLARTTNDPIDQGSRIDIEK